MRDLETSQSGNSVVSGAELTAESFVPDESIQKAWDDVYAEMRNEFGEAVFRSWLKPLTLQAFYHGTMEISVPTRFMRDWIQNHYQARLLEMCAEKNTEIRRI